MSVKNFVPMNGTPVLQYKGNKGEDNSFMMYPSRLLAILMKSLPLNCLKLMMLLCGTMPGFYVTEKWVESKTGLTHSRYMEARKRLSDMGWLHITPRGSLEVDFDAIYASEVHSTESVP